MTGLNQVRNSVNTQLKDVLEGMSLRGGDILWIQYRDQVNSVRYKTFQGTCVRVVRRGLDTVFTLRTMLGGVGVEFRFHSLSKNIRQVKKVRTRAQRGGRAKLYSLREA